MLTILFARETWVGEKTRAVEAAAGRFLLSGTRVWQAYVLLFFGRSARGACPRVGCVSRCCWVVDVVDDRGWISQLLFRAQTAVVGCGLLLFFNTAISSVVASSKLKNKSYLNKLRKRIGLDLNIRSV